MRKTAPLPCLFPPFQLGESVKCMNVVTNVAFVVVVSVSPTHAHTHTGTR